MMTRRSSTQADARGFNRLAPVYDHLAMTVFGNSLRAAQRCFLHRVKPEADVLVVGGGSGWFLERLLEETSCRRVDTLDISAAMLSRSEDRLRRRNPEALARVRFLHGGVESSPRDAIYDVLCTHCFLDLFSDETLQSLVPRLRSHLRDGGLWYDSDFQIAPGTIRGPLTSVLLRAMYAFFRTTCSIEATRLPQFDHAFSQAGMVDVEAATFYGGMVRARLLRAPDQYVSEPLDVSQGDTVTRRFEAIRSESDR